MIDTIFALFDRITSQLTPGAFEGDALYLISMLMITIVHFHFRKQWAEGLKGDNGLWEAPEMLLYLCLWLIPSMIYADIFLKRQASDIVWYAVMAFVFYAFTGRFGLNWLLAFRAGASEVKSTTTEKKTEVREETTKTEVK
ncbi:MAG: hypothetical protein QM762_12815 [Chryseolinea sp.]